MRVWTCRNSTPQSLKPKLGASAPLLWEQFVPSSAIPDSKGVLQSRCESIKDPAYGSQEEKWNPTLKSVSKQQC